MARNANAMLLTLLLSSGLTNALDNPSRMLAEPGEVEVALSPLSSRTSVGTSNISVIAPSDPEEALYGGSGGSFVELIATFNGSEVRGIVQAIYVFARPSDGGAPELSAWSKTGVSNFVMCRYVPLGDKYCSIWCQDYEVDHQVPLKAGPRREQQACN